MSRAGSIWERLSSPQRGHRGSRAARQPIVLRSPARGPQLLSPEEEEARWRDAELRRVNALIDDWNARRRDVLSRPLKKAIPLDTAELTDEQFIRIEDDFMRATGRTDRIITRADFRSSPLFHELVGASLDASSRRRERAIMIAGNLVPESKFELIGRDGGRSPTPMYFFLQKLFYNVSSARLEELFVRNCMMLQREFPLHMRFPRDVLDEMERVFDFYAEEPAGGSGGGRLVPLERLEEHAAGSLNGEWVRLSLQHSLRGIVPAAAPKPDSPRWLASASGSEAGSPLASFIWNSQQTRSNRRKAEGSYPALRPDGLPQALNFEDFVFAMKMAFPPFAVL